MSRPLSVLLWLQHPPRRSGGAQLRPPPTAGPAPARRRGAVRRFLARQWQLYQLTVLPPEAWEPFPWEEGFLRWSEDRLEGEHLPPTVGEPDDGRRGH